MSETVYRKHAKMGSAVAQDQPVCPSVIVFITSPFFFVTENWRIQRKLVKLQIKP